MTRAEARTAIQAATDHDGASDTQVTTAQLNSWIDIEHKLLRRQLAQIAPSLYMATAAEETLAALDETLTMPSDYESLVRLEVKNGSNWFPVPISDELNTQTGSLTVREQGGVLNVSPASLAAGTYRIIYAQKPVTLSADSSTNGVLLVPDGCEDIIVERVSARVREKCDEDPTPHLNRAATNWTEQRKALRKRYGKGGQPALRLVRGW